MFLLRKVSESPSGRNCVRDHCGNRKCVGSWSDHLAEDAELLAIHLLDHHCDFGRGYVASKFFGNVTLKLDGVFPAACTSPISGNEIFPSDRTGIVRERSASFQTLIAKTSPFPMT